jgi:DNA-binding MarR family transcriptional regulator
MLEFKHCHKPLAGGYACAVGEHRANDDRLAFGVPACRSAWDDVDRLLMEWAEQRPDLDFSPVGVVTRLSRVRTYLDAELAAVFARYQLSAADFLVIITLRRSGSPFRMQQARLMEALGLTSGTVSVRLDRLERSGIVTRESDPTSARASLVQLTQRGVDLFDQAAPAHLANEDRLLSALSPAERQTLADLLRRLQVSFESTVTHVAAPLGLTLEPAHTARARRQAVGLTDVPGLLVASVDPGSVAAASGIERGDLLVELDGSPVISSTGLALQLASLAGRRSTRVVLLRKDERLTLRMSLPKQDA